MASPSQGWRKQEGTRGSPTCLGSPASQLCANSAHGGSSHVGRGPSIGHPPPAVNGRLHYASPTATAQPPMKDISTLGSRSVSDERISEYRSVRRSHTPRTPSATS